MGKIPNNLNDTAVFLAQTLDNNLYAIRGTTSLVLQDLDFNVGDIDILSDEKTALECNNLFKEFLIEPVEYKETNQFKSFFGKFLINEISVEIMGNLQIKDKLGNWSKVFDGQERTKILINGQEVYVSTLESELSMFSSMQRWPVYHKIKKHLDVLNDTQLGLFQ